jgi:type I restriction enzyme S subunit
MYEKYMKKYGVPQSGDLLVTGVGTLGRLYVVKDYDKFYFKDGNIIWFKKSSFVNSIFVKYLFQTRIIKKQIEDNASITTVGTYTIDSAKKTQIPYPSILEQTKIANFLSAIDDKIHHTQRQIEGAEGWKKGLMQKMFV